MNNPVPIQCKYALLIVNDKPDLVEINSDNAK